jgi:hypothetical protein
VNSATGTRTLATHLHGEACQGLRIASHGKQFGEESMHMAPRVSSDSLLRPAISNWLKKGLVGRNART